MEYSWSKNGAGSIKEFGVRMDLGWNQDKVGQEQNQSRVGLKMEQGWNKNEVWLD